MLLPSESRQRSSVFSTLVHMYVILVLIFRVFITIQTDLMPEFKTKLVTLKTTFVLEYYLRNQSSFLAHTLGLSFVLTRVKCNY